MEELLIDKIYKQRKIVLKQLIENRNIEDKDLMLLLNLIEQHEIEINKEIEELDLRDENFWATRSDKEIDYEDFEILYQEYDCHGYCTPSGCSGHLSSQAIGFYLDGISFINDHASYGYYSAEKDQGDHMNSVVGELAKLFERESKTKKE